MPNIFEQNAQKKARKFDASAIFNEAAATNAQSLRQVVLAHSDMDGLFIKTPAIREMAGVCVMKMFYYS